MTSRSNFFASTLLTSVLCTLPAFANVQVTFSEGAPKDRFTIANTSDCALGPVDIVINLDGSSAGLIFDVTGSGAGVEVFQPFELVSGDSFVSTVPSIRDGDRSVTLSLSNLIKGQPVAFTVDVDDTAGGREITVSGSEILGASIAVQGTQAGVFGENAIAVAKFTGCKS